MTEITLITKNDEIVEFYGWNHAGYEKYGDDILCAAISVILQQGAAGILEYIKIPATFLVNKESGFLRLNLREPNLDKLNKMSMTLDSYNQIILENRREINAILGSMIIMLDQLKEQYPKYVKIFQEEAN